MNRSTHSPEEVAPRFDPEKVAAFAEAQGITLTPWQREALDTLATGGFVVRGRRCGWSLLQRLIQEEATNEHHLQAGR